jgi:CheY-like chemotaxis protein
MISTSEASLSGKTVAVIGLDRQLMFDTTSAVEAAGGRWQAFGNAESASLGGADVIVATAAAAAALVSASQPLLIIVATQDMSRVASDTAMDHDFIIAPPLRGEEVVLRVAHLLSGTPAKLRHAVVNPIVVAVDDDPTTIAIVRAVVSQNGMTCHTASDGRQALETIRNVNPALVILDVNMPFLDGFEVLAAIRQHPATRTVPVAMLTSVQQEADVVRAFALGADDYVVKPFNPMELLARIKRLVKKTS